MRYNIPVSLIRLSILAVALWCGVLTASAQTTAFSYQGQLNDNGSPANGAYDMQFKLFDALNIGTQVGSTVTLTNVTVSNGVFTVTLDFGAAAFPGANRWLEISVRLAGGGTFTTLTPRQPVTSTPYAIKSLNAATADGLSVACTGCVTSSQIGSLPTGSGNYIQNTTTQQASSNFNISGNGLIGGNVGIGTTSPLTKLDISGSQSLSNGMALSLFNANASNTNRWFLGTGGAFVDKSAFSIGDSSAIRMAILPNGNMGIGMVYPLAKLDVADGNIALNDGMLRLRNGLDANHGMLWTSTLDGTEFRGLGGFRWMTGSAGTTERMRIESNGNVGIGTISPLTKLDISGSDSLFNGVALSLFNSNASNTNRWVLGTGGVFVDKSAFSIGDSTAIRMAILSNGNVGIGTTNPGPRLAVAGLEASFHGKGAAIGLSNIATGGANWYLRAGATGTVTPAGGFSIADDIDYRLIINNSGNVGIGTTTPGSKLHVSSHDNAPAIWGYNDGGDIEFNPTTGIRGQSLTGNGVEGFGFFNGVYGSGAYGVRGIGGDVGVDGRGPVGVRGISDTGYGVYGSTGAGGLYAGVFGYAGGDGGNGVKGETTGKDGHGINGRAYGLDGIGVLGEVSNGSNAYAVWGISSGTSHVAGVFWGDVGISGNLSKGGGSFKIDHPLDPENMYLYHSFVESPDMMNIYNGNVTTNAEGEATVTMPDYFEALNRDFRYQLTVIGQFAQAIVGSKIIGNSFTIKTDKPNVEVSWQVTGVRQDAYANKHRIPVEEAKPDRERGFYIHPEVFGQSEEKNIEWARRPEMMRKMKEQREKSQQANQSQQR